MSVRLALRPDEPLSIQLRVSSVAAVLTGLRFAGSGHRVGDPGDDVLNPAGSAVHLSASATELARGARSTSAHRARGDCRGDRPLTPRRSGRASGTPRSRVPECPAARALPAEPVDVSWSRLRALLERDVRYRLRRLADRGLPGLFADLHPAVRLEDGLIRIATHCDADLPPTGGRLMLLPTFLGDRVVLLPADGPDPPVLLYPARIENDPGDPAISAESACRVVGGERLPLVRDLLAPCTADELAHRHSINPQNAHHHRALLASAGLLVPCDQSPARYTRTGLAGVFVNPWCSDCS